MVFLSIAGQAWSGLAVLEQAAVKMTWAEEW